MSISGCKDLRKPTRCYRTAIPCRPRGWSALQRISKATCCTWPSWKETLKQYSSGFGRSRQNFRSSSRRFTKVSNVLEDLRELLIVWHCIFSNWGKFWTNQRRGRRIRCCYQREKTRYSANLWANLDHQGRRSSKLRLGKSAWCVKKIFYLSFAPVDSLFCR